MTDSSTFTDLKRSVSDADVVLDLGTKDGENVSGLAGTILAMDISADQFDSGTAVEYILGDGHRLPLRSNSVDYVFCTQVLEHVPGTGRLIADVARVLKPRGTAYFNFPNRLALDQPHAPIPRWYSLLPRRLGRLLGGYLLTEAHREYYERAVFPLSPIEARRHMQDHFENVRFPMRLDPSSMTANETLQRILWWLNTVAMYPPLKWLGELLWPYSSYVCTDPVVGDE